MDTAVSFILLLILAVLIFGVPIILLAITLFETVSERRESARRAEDRAAAEEGLLAEKRATKNAGEWTPAEDMR